MKMHSNMKHVSKWLVPALAVSMLLGACGSQKQTKNNYLSKIEGKKPNVLFILVDDMGFNDLSSYGQSILSTPKIDELASQGLSFYNHYTGAPVCAPSRASLLTGKHTGNTNVRGNSPDQLLSDNEETLAKLMKRAGYVTGGIGKWGIGHPPPPDDPEKKGFDYFYGYVNMWHAHNFYPEFMYRNGEKAPLDNKTQMVDGKNPWAHMPEGTGVAEVRKQYAHDLFNTEAVNFIEANKDTNFFLYLALNVPHANNEGIPDGMEVPSYGPYADKDWPVQEKGFAAMMANIDTTVGMLQDKLKELGIDQNTLVIFCSDNGPHQEGGHKMEFFNSNGNLKGMKRDLYEGGVKTPLIVKWPGLVDANTKTNHLSAFWDFLPTFAELTGTPIEGETDGISMLPTILGDTADQKQHDYLYWEFYEQGGRQSVLKDGWKCIKFDIQTDEPYYELYNLNEDPDELNNVADANPEKIKEMQAIMDTAHKPFDKADLFTPSSEYNTPF